MDIDPKDLIDTASAAHERQPATPDRLNATVAVTVAILATFMGICKVKDDNIVQAMQQAQADKLDHWAYYQARTIRQELAQATATQLELAQISAPAAAASAYQREATRYKTQAAEQAQKRHEVQSQAEQDQKNYDALNYRDDQFDLSDALLAIAIAMLAVTALTQLWPLYVASLVPTFFGVLMGLAGLCAWPIHPDTLIQLLS
ncbi:MAG: DUF4337 domain-containing protein [Burkholderiales bacterium]|nr:DUF4337 domain-containing protein [Burkholderiales bacterium]